MPKVNGGGIFQASTDATPYSVPQNTAYRGFNIALNCGNETSNQCSGFFKADSDVPASPVYSALSRPEKKRFLTVLSSTFDFFSMNRNIALAIFCRSNGIHAKLLLHRLRSTGMSTCGKKMILERYGVAYDDLKKSVSAISANVTSDHYMDLSGKINIDACDALLQTQANAVIEAQIQEYLSRTIDPTGSDAEQDAWVMGLLSQPPDIPVPAYTALLPIERRRVLTVITCMFDFFPKNHHEMPISAFGHSNGIPPSTNLFGRLKSTEMLSRGKKMIYAQYGVGYDDLKKSVSTISEKEVSDRYMDSNGRVNIDACDALLKAHANAIIGARIQK